MKRTGTALCVMTIVATLFSGCSPQAAPAPTPAKQGKQSYSGYQAPAADKQLVMDARNSQAGDKTRSAHAMAYELESVPAVKGAAVLVVRHDAFVGVRPSLQGQTLHEADRQVIATKIKQMDKTITKVYITAEPAAVQYLSDFTGALEQGRPIASYEDRFKDMLQKTWPTGTR